MAWTIIWFHQLACEKVIHGWESGCDGVPPRHALNGRVSSCSDAKGQSIHSELGEDDYSEPLEILIKSANKNNEFNLFGTFAFKNQLKDRLRMRSKLYSFIKDKNLPSTADPIFVIGLPRSGTTFLFNLLAFILR